MNREQIIALIKSKYVEYSRKSEERPAEIAYASVLLEIMRMMHAICTPEELSEWNKARGIS